MLYSIKEWDVAPLLPAAHSQEDNLITDSSYRGWEEAIIQNYDKVDSITRQELEALNIPTKDALRLRYSQLTYLNKQNFVNGLIHIANDISKTFNPAETLFLLEGGSSSMIFKLLTEKRRDIAQFGCIEWDINASDYYIKHRAAYEGVGSLDANRIIYLDDWVLSSMQVEGVVGGCKDPCKRFFSYHLVMSDKGHDLYSTKGLEGKYCYKVTGDYGPTAFYGTYPIFGWHKIPDRLSDVYLGYMYHSLPSIFPSYVGPFVRGERLVSSLSEALADVDLYNV